MFVRLSPLPYMCALKTTFDFFDSLRHLSYPISPSLGVCMHVYKAKIRMEFLQENFPSWQIYC